MGKAEKDTRRIDVRIDGLEEKDSGRRALDQRIGGEEKPLAQELKEKELLRKGEDTSRLTRIRLEREAKEKRERVEEEDQRIHDKKAETIRIQSP